MFNPNQMYMPLRTVAPAIKKTIDWAGLLSNTQKTLNIVNQAIPIVYQAKPIFKNARTMFRVASEFSKSNNSSNVNNSVKNNYKQNYYNNLNSDYDDNGPSFFI